MRAGRIVSIVLTLFLVFLVNAPLARLAWDDYRLRSDGVDVTLRVTDHETRGGSYLLLTSLPASLGEERPLRLNVTRETYDAGVARGTVAARMLPSDLTVYEVDGERKSNVGLWVVLAADVVLVAGIVLVTRIRPRLRPELVLRATEDLEACPPGSVLDRLDGLFYTVAGVVVESDDDEVLLDLGDRRVRVVLDGHRNPVGADEPAQVTGVMIA